MLVSLNRLKQRATLARITQLVNSVLAKTEQKFKPVYFTAVPIIATVEVSAATILTVLVCLQVATVLTIAAIL